MDWQDRYSVNRATENSTPKVMDRFRASSFLLYRVQGLTVCWQKTGLFEETCIVLSKSVSVFDLRNVSHAIKSSHASTVRKGTSLLQHPKNSQMRLQHRGVMSEPSRRDEEHHPTGTRAGLGAAAPKVVWGWSRPALAMPVKLMGCCENSDQECQSVLVSTGIVNLLPRSWHGAVFWI